MVKDSMSCTSDNKTPSSLLETSTARSFLKNENTKKTSSYCELKRNLVEVYELEESPSQSATKSRVNHAPAEGLKADFEPTLLIPKMEK
ncbi:hypothetical protein Hanom_Chr17g01558731 [Helianthus anomalus]